MGISEVTQNCRTILKNYYGPRFKGLLLYGSLARDQAGSASDIDLLVLLNKPLDYFRELRQIIDLLYPVQLDTDRLISAKPAAFDEFEEGSISFYRNAKKEGILL